MRNAPTPAEKKLWGFLRASQLDGAKFSRQIAIGPFIADFCARSRKLIVEVDGSQHGGIGDLRRTRWLEREGYTVVRSSNRQVLVETEGVLLAIVAACRDCPPPTPPVPGGESGWGNCSRDDDELPY